MLAISQSGKQHDSPELSPGAVEGVWVASQRPCSELEVNGDAQADGNFTLSGSMLLSDEAGPMIQVPNNETNSFSAGLDALPLPRSVHSNRTEQLPLRNGF